MATTMSLSPVAHAETPRQASLWRHSDFLKLWGGQTISQCGSQVSDLALPLTAALVLGATPGQMGLLRAASFAPFLLFGLFAGVLVDRSRRRPIMIAADVGRAFLLLTIPLAAVMGWLRIEQLYVVGIAACTLTVLFDVAYQSYLPLLVGRAGLVEGNSKLEVSRSMAYVAGPSLAGALVQVLMAPMAVVLDALSYLSSAACLIMIRTVEPASAATRASERRGVWAEIGDGMSAVMRSAVLRPLAISTATFNLFFNVLFAMYILYVTRELSIGPAVLGMILAAFGVGGVIGAVGAGLLARRGGVGPTISGGLCLSGLGALLVPAASGPPPAVIGALALGNGLFGIGVVTYVVTALSLRQTITPDHLQGRVNATMRFITWGAMPPGALVGGALGELVGLRATLLCGALGMLLGGVFLLLSPVRTVSEPRGSFAPVTNQYGGST